MTHILLWTKWFVPPNLYIKTLTHGVSIFGDRACKELIRLNEVISLRSWLDEISVPTKPPENENTTYWMRENILKPFFDKGIISKIYKVLIQLNNKKSKKLSKKINRWPMGHENVLNNTNHQGNANQNHN